MRAVLFFVWLQIVATAGLSQSLPFDNPQAIHFQRTNLVVRWKTSEHPWPRTLWTYHVLRTQFSPAVISNVMALGPFSDRDTWHHDADGVVFWRGYGAPSLTISFSGGVIDYDGRTKRYSPTNLAKDVPGTNQLFRLTTNFLPKIGISLSEIAERENGQPKIGWHSETTDYTLYSEGDSVVTNVEYRHVHFPRALDGVEFRGNGGDCAIEFGEHSQIIKLQLYWRSVERDKAYAAAAPKQIIKWIREGKAIQKRMLTEKDGETIIDWATVKNLTVRTAKAYYWGEFIDPRPGVHSLSFPSWVRPYVEISGIVDTGTTNVYVEIVCPVIDETRPLAEK